MIPSKVMKTVGIILLCSCLGIVGFNMNPRGFDKETVFDSYAVAYRDLDKGVSLSSTDPASYVANGANGNSIPGVTPSTQTGGGGSSSVSDPTGNDGQAVVDYAMQFLGNPYVYGGTSLTKGIDCSGFTMRIYEKFGKKLPHSSYSQRSCGKEVKNPSPSNMLPGDIVCYSGHVGIYDGKGGLIHASNRRDGIKHSKTYAYKTVITVRRIL